MNLKVSFFRSGIAAALLAMGLQASAQLKAELFSSGLTLPIGLVGHPTDPTLMFVIEQRSGSTGRIRILQNGTLLATPFLSVSPVSTGSEQGLLGLAFAPDYGTSGFFYVNYTDSGGTTNVVRYQRNALDPLIADAGSAKTILKIAQPFANHNGGDLVFGSDGMLYIGTGDGGSGNDPGNRAQNTTLLLGKMLRIDPTGDDFPADPDRNYRIPADNPFAGSGSVANEIWAIGLRNPWRYTFDPISMLGYDTWLIGDVGQDAWEEIDYEFPGQSGRNYGWRVWEGNHSTGLGGQSTVIATDTFPIFEYDHGVGESITGGYVYRGIELGPEFFGRYFYGDFITSKIWSLGLNVDPIAKTVSSNTNTDHSAALSAGGNISTFGIDANGELYYCKYGAGQVWRIKPLNRVWMADVTPYLSRLFSGTLRHLVANDGNAFRVTPLDTADRDGTLNFQGGIEVGFKTDQTTTPNLNATIVVSTNQSVGGTARLLLRNWTTNNFVEVGSGAFSTSPSTITINNIPAANYRRNSDGRIEARVRGDVSVSGFASKTLVNFEQVRLTSN